MKVEARKVAVTLSYTSTAVLLSSLRSSPSALLAPKPLLDPLVSL